MWAGLCANGDGEESLEILSDTEEKGGPRKGCCEFSRKAVSK